MASPRIKTSSQEAALAVVRVLTLAVVVLIVGTAVWLTAVIAGVPFGLAAAMGGALAGVVGFALMAFGSLYEVKVFTCPHCQHTDKTLKNIGYYNCFNCGTQYRIDGQQVVSAIPTQDTQVQPYNCAC